jgi:alkylhydroperoxidase/carboxymuconolactone decarboxylase family protein YurZ
MGATRAEIEETIAVAVYMGGGPSLMYGADALAAFEQFEQAKAAHAVET